MIFLKFNQKELSHFKKKDIIIWYFQKLFQIYSRNFVVNIFNGLIDFKKTNL